jgi:hypothetical protein
MTRGVSHGDCSETLQLAGLFHGILYSMGRTAIIQWSFVIHNVKCHNRRALKVLVLQTFQIDPQLCEASFQFGNSPFA